MLHRFEIALADVDRSVYESLDLRTVRHPSEDNPYLLTRVLAFALEYEPDLEFGGGVSSGGEPAIWRRAPDGRVLTWIEVGAPAPDRLHRASKLADRTAVWCHRRPDLLQQKCAKEKVHAADRIRLAKVPGDLLDALERHLDRNNRWDLSHHEGRVTVVVGGEAIEAAIDVVPLVPAGGG